MVDEDENAGVDEDIYMEIPEGYRAGREHMVCKLKKALYGLKESPRLWALERDRELACLELDYKGEKYSWQGRGRIRALGGSKASARRKSRSRKLRACCASTWMTCSWSGTLGSQKRF